MSTYQGVYIYRNCVDLIEQNRAIMALRSAESTGPTPKPCTEQTRQHRRDAANRRWAKTATAKGTQS